MNIETSIDINLLLNVGTILFFAGAWWQNTKHNKETIESIKESFKTSIDLVKDDFQNQLSAMKESVNNSFTNIKEFYNEKLSDLKEHINEHITENAHHTAEQINRLEEKQDRHNALYDKVIEANQSAKAAHHRIDEIAAHRG